MGPVGPAGSLSDGASGSSWSSICSWTPLISPTLSVISSPPVFPLAFVAGGALVPLVPVVTTYKGFLETSPYEVTVGGPQGVQVRFASPGLYRLSLTLTFTPDVFVGTHYRFYLYGDDGRELVTLVEVTGGTVYSGVYRQIVVPITKTTVTYSLYIGHTGLPAALIVLKRAAFTVEALF